MVKANLQNTDAFVIGGGPAGLAAALALRQRGLAVSVADSLAPPIDKPCGEGLMPDGIAALKKLGVTIPAIDSHAFRGIRFVSSGLRSEAVFPTGTALGVRRTSLHRTMVEHAADGGVHLLWRAVVTGIHGHTVMVNGQSIRTRWIIGADGSQSRVRGWAALDNHRHKEQRYAFRRHYKVAPWSDFMELHWGLACQLYITPIASDEICLALISRNPKLRLDDALRNFPDIRARIVGAPHGSAQRGAVSVTRKLAQVCRGNVALIGDAAGGVDAITGEGLCLAFHHAALLADCISTENLRRYQVGHRLLTRRPALMARLILLLENHRLRARVMKCFASKPELFANMLATHVGSASPFEAAANGLAFGWDLLTAR